jgi:hypothetical protein
MASAKEASTASGSQNGNQADQPKHALLTFTLCNRYIFFICCTPFDLPSPEIVVFQRKSGMQPGGQLNQ